MYIWKKEIPILLTGSLDSVIMKIKDSFQRLSRSNFRKQPARR
jgi:hypothetical protein